MLDLVIGATRLAKDSINVSVKVVSGNAERGLACVDNSVDRVCELPRIVTWFSSECNCGIIQRPEKVIFSFKVLDISIN